VTSLFENKLEVLEADRCPDCKGTGNPVDNILMGVRIEIRSCELCEGTGMLSKGMDDN
jgi:DnaJ-class molecular chaperone